MNQLKYLFKRFRVYIENSIWVVLGLALRTLITIFIVSRIANQLGTEHFGWYNLGISVFTVLFAISSLGFNPSFIIKHLVNDSKNSNSILGTTLISRAICSLILLLILAIWIFFFTEEANYWVLLIATACIFFQSSEVLKSYFQWKLKAKVYVSIGSICLLIEAILLIIGLYYEYDLFYFITVYLLERVLMLFGMLFVFHKNVTPLRFLKFDYAYFKIIVVQSWPLLLGGLLTALYARFDQFLIKFFLDANELGIYGTGVILTQIWLIVPSIIIPIVYPKIAEFKNTGNKKKYTSLILGLYALLNYSALAVIILMFIFGEWIIVTLYGEAYIDSVYILKILIVNLMILFQSHLTTSVMIIEGNEKFLFKIKLVSVVINIGLNVFLLSKYGVEVAAYSLIVSSFVSWILISIFNKDMKRLVALNLKSYTTPFNIRKLLK
jgi:O-antigen/teichoic acid export membrane protein